MNYDKISFLKGVETGRKLFRKFGNGTNREGSFDGQPIPYLAIEDYPDNSQELFEAGYLAGISHNATIEGVVPEGERGDMYYSFCVRLQDADNMCYVCGFSGSSSAYFFPISLLVRPEIICTVLLRTTASSYYYTFPTPLTPRYSAHLYSLSYSPLSDDGIVYRNDTMDGNTFCPEVTDFDDAFNMLYQYIEPEYIEFTGQPIPVLDELLYPDNSEALFNAGVFIGNVNSAYAYSACSRLDADCYIVVERLFADLSVPFYKVVSPTYNASVTITERISTYGGKISYHTVREDLTSREDQYYHIYTSDNGTGIVDNIRVPISRSRFDTVASLAEWLKHHSSVQTRGARNALRSTSSSSYDNTSFLAGLAVGRALWRPPTLRGGADTGLGWEADPAWMTYNAGIVATAPAGNRTPYTKVNNGWTIICTLFNGDDGHWGGDWSDVITISTIRDNTIVTVPNAQQWIKTYTYLGLTWYVGVSGQNASWGGNTVINSNFPAIDMEGEQVVYDRASNPTLIESVFLRIMQEAGVRLTS